MKNRTIMTMALLIACLALAVAIIPTENSDGADDDEEPIAYASELTTFSGTASELWPDSDIVEYYLDGPVIIQITPDSADGYDYEVYKTLSNVMHIDVVNGGVDALIAETMYTNIVLKRTDSNGQVENRTLFIYVTTLAQDGGTIYGSREDVEVSITPGANAIRVGQSYEVGLSIAPAAFNGYVHNIVWSTSSSAIATISNSGTPGQSLSETVQGVAVGSTAINALVNLREPDATQDPGYQSYTFRVHADVSVFQGYIIKWMSQDGETLLSATDAQEGDAPTYNGTTPTKEHTAQYRYTFKGWATKINQESGKQVSALPVVTKDTTYYAAFAATLKTYTLTFSATNGSVDTSSVLVQYGDTISINGGVLHVGNFTVRATPNTGYELSSWNVESGQVVEGSMTIKAYFTLKTYTVYFDTLGVGQLTRNTITNVPHGSEITVRYNTVSINGVTVEALLTGGSSLTWLNVSGTITGSRTITADFREPNAQYTVTWKSQDGNTVLETDSNVNEGSQPDFNSTQPTKAATAQYTYRFAGWSTVRNSESGAPDTSLPTVSGDTTYYAAFSKTVNKYVVRFTSNDSGLGTFSPQLVMVDYNTSIVQNQDGTLTIGQYTIQPITETNTSEFNYTFVGWTGTIPSKVTSNLEITGEFAKTAIETSAGTYTVIWKSWDGTNTIETDTGVAANSKPSFNGNNPTKAADAQFTYTFVGWSTDPNSTNGVLAANLPNVTENVTYYAAFSKTTNYCTITWMSQDGSSPLRTSMVLYGATLEYNGITPAKVSTAQYTYTFAGWSDTPNSTEGVEPSSLPAATGDATYYAAFSESIRTYTVTWKSNDGRTTLEIDTNVNYGTKPIFNGNNPTKAADVQFTYTFEGWSTTSYDVSGTDASLLPTVSGNTTYYAAFSKTAKQYTVTFSTNNSSYGTISQQSIAVDYNTEIVQNQDNTLTIGQYTIQPITAANTSTSNYSFSGWSGIPSSGKVTGNLQITGTFTKTTIEAPAGTYTVIWKSSDGALTLETDTGVAANSKPSFDSDTPTKTGLGYTYTFRGWSTSPNSTSGTMVADLPNVTKNVTYYAAFSAATVECVVSFGTNDRSYGSVDASSVTVDYGSVIHVNGATITIGDRTIRATPADSTAQYTYSFSEWSVNDGYTVTGNLMITATFARAPVGTDPETPGVTDVRITSKTMIGIGESLRLTASVTATGGASTDIRWEIVGNQGIISMNGDTITGLSAGMTKIKATSAFDDSKYCEMTIIVSEGSTDSGSIPGGIMELFEQIGVSEDMVPKVVIGAFIAVIIGLLIITRL